VQTCSVRLSPSKDGFCLHQTHFDRRSADRFPFADIMKPRASSIHQAKTVSSGVEVLFTRVKALFKSKNPQREVAASILVAAACDCIFADASGSSSRMSAHRQSGKKPIGAMRIE